MKAIIPIVALSMCVAPGPARTQGIKDLFNGIKNAAKQKVDEEITTRVEAPCLQKEDSAKVDAIDSEKTGTWVVETTDGRKFQVSDLAIAGVTDDGQNVATFLSMASTASFSLVSQDRLTKTYRVNIDYAPAETGGGVRGFFGSLANNVAQSTMKNNFQFQNVSIGGSAMDGREWCLNIPSSTLSRIRLVKN